jgi:hypothetical protein
VLPDAVPHHAAQPLHRLLPHVRLRLAVAASPPPPLGVWRWGCGCGRETKFRIQHSN